MSKLIENLRYTAYIAVFSSFVSALFVLVIGAYKVYKAIYGYVTGTGTTIFAGTTQEKVLTHLSQEDAALARIIESVDTFLMALVLFYLGYGMYNLFCEKHGKEPASLPAAIAPRSIGQLKETLAHIILVVLIVLFTRQVWLNLNKLSWDLLVIPVSVALFALAIKLANFSHKA